MTCATDPASASTVNWNRSRHSSRPLSGQRIPNPSESEVAEVLFVDGGEVGDALLEEDEGGPPIEGAAAGGARNQRFGAVAIQQQRFTRKFGSALDVFL